MPSSRPAISRKPRSEGSTYGVRPARRMNVMQQGCPGCTWFSSLAQERSHAIWEPTQLQPVTDGRAEPRARSTQIADYFRWPGWPVRSLRYTQIVRYGTAHHQHYNRKIMSRVCRQLPPAGASDYVRGNGPRLLASLGAEAHRTRRVDVSCWGHPSTSRVPPRRA